MELLSRHEWLKSYLYYLPISHMTQSHNMYIAGKASLYLSNKKKLLFMLENTMWCKKKCAWEKFQTHVCGNYFHKKKQFHLIVCITNERENWSTHIFLLVLLILRKTCGKEEMHNILLWKITTFLNKFN